MRLIDILTLKRPSRGAGMLQLRDELRAEMGGDLDGYGNLWIRQGGGTLFSAHLDTVHHSEGVNPVRRKRGLWSADGGECLGADDGAGIWILCQMIETAVRGDFVFTLDEEVGCKGARWIAENLDLTGYSRAVAFDRRGTTDLCQFQTGLKMASNEFIGALSKAIGMGHTAESGIYTDNAEWSHMIPEIVNISCGYENAHGPKEYLDVEYLRELSAKAVSLDWDALPTVRDPHEYTADVWDYPADSLDLSADIADLAMINISDSLGLDRRMPEYAEIRRAIVEAYHDIMG